MMRRLPYIVGYKARALCLLATIVLMLTIPAAGGQHSPVPTPDYQSINGDTGSGPTTTDQYTLQVSALKKINNVGKELSRLRSAGEKPFYRYEDTGGKGMWYRVYCGRYQTRQEAREAAERKKLKGIISYYNIRKLDRKGDYRSEVNSDKKHLPAGRSRINDNSDKQEIHSVQKKREAVQQPPVTAMDAARTRPPVKKATLPDKHASEIKLDNAPIRLLLSDAILYSLEGNREIQVVSFTPQQAREDVKDAEAVYDSLLFADASFRRDPNLESSVTDIVTEDEGLTQTGVRKPLKTGGQLSTYLETRYSRLNNAEFERRYKHIVSPTVELRQPLLNNIGSQREQTAIKIANYRANISEEEFRAKVIEISSRVAKAYWKLYLYREIVTINRQNLDMADEIFRREAERLQRGISQRIDVERARSNAHVRRSALLNSVKEYRIAMDRLKLLLNWERLQIDSDDVVIPVEPPRIEPLDLDESEAIATALQNRPELAEIKQEQNIRLADEDLAAHQRLPKLDAIGRYSLSGYGDDFSDSVDDMGMNDEDSWEVGLKFEWSFGNHAADARYRKKILRRKQLDAYLKQVEDDIKLDIKQILHSIESASGEIKATQEAKEAAEKVVQGEFTRFEIGQTSNEELLRAQDLLALTSRGYIRSVVGYNIALQEFTHTQGLLPNGVTIEQAHR